MMLAGGKKYKSGKEGDTMTAGGMKSAKEMMRTGRRYDKSRRELC